MLASHRSKLPLMALCISVGVSAAAAEDKKEEFLSRTGLIEGEYELTTGPASCPDGDLVLSRDEVGGLTLSLGANAIITDIGNSPKTERERKCTTDSKTVVSKGKVIGLSEEKCSDQEKIMQYGNEVDVVPRGIVYEHQVYSGGELVEHQTCVLKRVKP